jgi:hypothetical protein
VHLQKVLEVVSTSIYTGLNPFNFIRKHFLQMCVGKIAVHLQKVLEVVSTSIYTGLNPFNFIHKRFLQMCVGKVAVHLKKVLEVLFTSVYTGLNRGLSTRRLSERTAQCGMFFYIGLQWWHFRREVRKITDTSIHGSRFFGPRYVP